MSEPGVSQSVARAGILLGCAIVGTLVWIFLASHTVENIDTESKTEIIYDLYEHQEDAAFIRNDDVLVDSIVQKRYSGRLFYNRVPKCGSRTVVETLFRLRDSLGFNMAWAEETYPYHLNSTQQEIFAEYFNNLNPSTVYNRHLHFIDLKKFNVTQPAYINVVRHPLDRTISQHYFTNNIENQTESFDDCMARDVTQGRCAPHLEDTHMLTQFFCGHDPICRTEDPAALSLAKSNIVEHYAVVGLTEDLPAFFTAAEHVLPAYFKGAPQIFKKFGEVYRKDTSTRKKGEASAHTRNILTERLSQDIQLYNWIKQRFYTTFSGLLEQVKIPVEII